MSGHRRSLSFALVVAVSACLAFAPAAAGTVGCESLAHRLPRLGQPLPVALSVSTPCGHFLIAHSGAVVRSRPAPRPVPAGASCVLQCTRPNLRHPTGSNSTPRRWRAESQFALAALVRLRVDLHVAALFRTLLRQAKPTLVRRVS